PFSPRCVKIRIAIGSINIAPNTHNPLAAACYNSPMPHNPDLDHWECRFASEEFRFGKEPNEFLVRCKPLLPRTGKVLAVADGEGRNGVWLARQGLEVTSTDFSPSAQSKGRKLAAENNV